LRAVRALKAMRDRGVMPTTATCVSIANACGRRHAAAPLGELSAVLLLIRTAIGPAAYAEAAQACVAAGAPPETLLGEAAPASADATDGSTSTTNAPPPPRKTSLSSGAVDAKAERAALDAVQKSQLLREREELRTRCAQLVALLGRRTRAMERLRLELPEEHMHLVDAAEHATEGGEDEDEDDGTGPNADDGDAEGAGGGGGSSSALVVRAEDEGGPRGGSFDSRSELEVRYEEMTKVARERQSALLALQKTHGETEAQCRRLTRQVAAAGLSDAMAREAENAADIDQALFGTGGSVKSKAKPPDGWPSEIEYTNQLLWDEVPVERHFLRDRIADVGVKRAHRLKIVLIKNKKHPCCGERGLYAGEDIPAGAHLLDYCGKISVVVGEEPDSNRSSFLLNLFKEDEAGVYIDIDAARCGNEGRFVNDYHGTGASGPNAQFWPYFDVTTGEKRMSIKSIAPLTSGEEIFVDYGGMYFEKDSDQDSDMHSSDDDFDGERAGAGGRKKAKRFRAAAGGSPRKPPAKKKRSK